jgi:nucleoside 2-deoxyribosyltransferase
MTCVYLGGPIYNCSDEECITWRENVKKILTKKGYTYKDPVVRDYRGHEAEHYKFIVEKDLIEIAESDILLVNLFKPSWGTAMELVYAFFLEKRIVIVTPPELALSPWVMYHASEIYKIPIEIVAENL